MPFSGKLQSPYLVAVAIAVLYLVLLVWLWGHFQGDPLGFVHRGTVFSDGDPAGTRGYDGQFYYYTAVDPWNAAQHMDNATFRLQRIFYPLVIIALSFGQAALVPYAMILITYLAIVGGTLLVALLLARWGRSPWFAVGYAFCGGLPVALTFVTAEPLAFGLVALGVFLWDHADPVLHRPSLKEHSEQSVGRAGQSRTTLYWRYLIGGALALAAALLTRELALYFVAAYALVAFYLSGKEGIAVAIERGAGALPDGIRRGLRDHGATLLLAVAALVPVTLWSAYLSATSHYLGVSFVQPFEYIPFQAYLLQLTNPNARSAGYASQYMIPATLFGALAIWQLIRTWRWPSPLLIALLGNVHLMTFLPRLGYQHQVASSRYLLGLALAAVLWAGSSKPRWLLWLTLVFVLSFLVYLYGLAKQDPAYLW